MLSKTTKSKKNKVILQKPIHTAEWWKRQHAPKTISGKPNKAKK